MSLVSFKHLTPKSSSSRVCCVIFISCIFKALLQLDQKKKKKKRFDLIHRITIFTICGDKNWWNIFLYFLFEVVIFRFCVINFQIRTFFCQRCCVVQITTNLLTSHITTYYFFEMLCDSYNISDQRNLLSILWDSVSEINSFIFPPLYFQ